MISSRCTVEGNLDIPRLLEKAFGKQKVVQRRAITHGILPFKVILSGEVQGWVTQPEVALSDLKCALLNSF